VLLVEKKVETSLGKFEERSWYELRDTPCARDATTTRDFEGPQFTSVDALSHPRVQFLRKQLDARGIAY
jgi:hypothetical protein